MKKIVVITGSPRKGGNSDLMADAFMKGAAKNEHQLVKIAAAELGIQGCRACDGCYSTGHPCIFSDNFNNIAPLLEEADVIVFATPLYWFSFSEQIKAIIDRFYSLVRGHGGFKKEKECVLLAAGGGSAKDFAGLKTTYELIVNFMGWRNLGQICASGVNAKGDVKKTDVLTQVKALGESL